ncbi:MAG: DUF4430 domain-containing protein [Halanaerobiaceae bacterium]
MKQKLTIIVLAVIIGALLLGVYNLILAPEGEEGLKEVTIEVIIEKEDVEETFTYETEHEFLQELLDEKESELEASFETSERGTMVTGMMDYEAQDGEFFALLVNDEQAETGSEEIVLQDGDKYTFELTEF